MSAIMMKCGHSTVGRDQNGDPVCPICLGIRPGAREVANDSETEAQLAGRYMRCAYGKRRDGQPCENHTTPKPSSISAAFFHHQPKQEFDSYYCGCWGWD